ncbi:FGGY family carbohydrate kinase [Streptomyces sp. NPDC002790]|uniref:FGGY family carbohydrate kinase n=1 Tax=Streptomyces sp. NPDC002790 TaxID=3154431 RepID=UPI00331EBE25
MWFLGIDIGTTHLKTVGVTDEGAVLPAGRIRTPTVTRDGLTFHDAEEVWTRTRELVTRYAATTAHPHGALAGVCVASFGQEEAVPVDTRGQALHPSLAWWQNPPRTALTPDTAELLDSYEHYTATGMRHRPAQTPERTAHLRAEQPEVWRSTARWVDFGSLAVHRMTGRWTSAAAQLTHSQCFDLVTLEPLPDVMHRLGLTPTMFPEPLPVGAIAGALRPDVLPGVTLAGEVPVVIGGHDQVVAAHGVHRDSGARVLDSIGTSEYLMVASDSYAPERRAWDLGIDHSRSWSAQGYLLGSATPTGKLVQLLADLFYDGDFDALFVALATQPPGPDTALHVDLAGPDTSDEGLLSISGLAPGLRAADLVRHALDRVADHTHTVLGEMCALAGIQPDTVALAGSLWRRPEMAAHRQARWGIDLDVRTVPEPVAESAARIALDAVLPGAAGAPPLNSAENKEVGPQ